MLKVKINYATIKIQQKSLKWLNKKYGKPRNLEIEGVKCQKRFETSHPNGDDDEIKNLSDTYSSSFDEISENSSKQVRSIISKKKN